MHGVATGTTGHTTGKVTSQHGLIYSRLVAEHGEEIARGYGAAKQAAVAKVAELAATTNADCDRTTAAAYVYTCEPGTVEAIEHEAGTAARLGLPATLADPAEITHAFRVGLVITACIAAAAGPLAYFGLAPHVNAPCTARRVHCAIDGAPLQPEPQH